MAPNNYEFSVQRIMCLVGLRQAQRISQLILRTGLTRIGYGFWAVCGEMQKVFAVLSCSLCFHATCCWVLSIKVLERTFEKSEELYSLKGGRRGFDRSTGESRSNSWQTGRNPGLQFGGISRVSRSWFCRGPARLCLSFVVADPVAAKSEFEG